MKSLKLFIYCFFFTSILQGQSTLPEVAPYIVAKQQIKIFGADNPASIPFFHQLAEEYYWINEDSAQYFLQLGLQLAKKANKETQVAEFYLLKGHIYKDSLIHYANLAKSLFEKNNNQAGIGRYHQLIALEYFNSNKMEAAYKHDLKALEVFEKANDEIGIGDAYAALAHNHFWSTDMEKAPEFGEKALSNYQRKGAVMRLIGQHIDLGNFYRALRKFEKAIKHLNTSIELAEQYQYSLLLQDGKSHLAILYMDQRKTKESIQLFKEIQANAPPNQDPNLKLVNVANLGLAYLAQGDYQEAIPRLRTAIQLAQEFEETYYLTEFPDSLTKAFLALGQFDSAYHYTKLSLDSYKTVFETSTQARIEEIKAQYETEIKETTIAQQGKQISNQRLIIGFILLLAAIFGIAGFFLYRLTSQLKQRNIEKEYLIKEIHHRVKNNLQIISSLLNLQTSAIEDDKAMNAVIEGRNRVQSMGLIHQKLYMGENVASINMDNYLVDLANHLLASFGKDNGQVTIESSIDLPPLDVDTAIPLGLIINELLTNSLKYAFDETDSGKIGVQLFIDQQKELHLLIEDNGKGVTQKKETSSTKFGTKIVQILSKKLKGKVQKVASPTGYKTHIIFSRYRLGVGN